MKRLLNIVAIAALSVIAAPLLAQTAKAPPTTADAEAVRRIIEERFPGISIKYIAKSPYFGLYEALADEQMLYVDPKVSYVFVGTVYDGKTRTNLTERKVREINRVDVAALPINMAIKKVKGNGSRKLVVFSDADCPFCKRLEESLKNVNDVTIYTFLFPIDQLHPDAARKSRLIWCSADKTKAWDEFFESGALPSNSGDCDNPVAATQALGNRLRIRATPTLVFADGTLVPGALPAAGIESELARAEGEVKKVAESK
ncbi:MAG TPA: DsbC family protein [Casimicrobiaceae bacterium]|nr:DsbC family protein [Casimicrobiaceae bacterium]